MKSNPLRHWLLSPWRIHALCAALSLVACVPILWEHPSWEEGYQVSTYAGITIALLFALSLSAEVISLVVLLSRLRNGTAFGYAVAWVGQWGAAFLIFLGLTIVANVPVIAEVDNVPPIQDTDILYTPNETLSGPSTLVIPINPDDFDNKKIETAANLVDLETNHPDILDQFIHASPKWGDNKEKNFYTRPGHVVMIMGGASASPNLVHVAFRSMSSGEPIPPGYLVVKPGDEIPTKRDSQEPLPDIALDLGGSHFLLLVWRGGNNPVLAAKAINAAIAAVDESLRPLAASPSESTIREMINGKRSVIGRTPEIRLSEPPAQYGSYQAEIYANPGEAGVLLLYIKDLPTGKTLQLISCPAQYSDNKKELFRYDIPGSIPLWMRRSTLHRAMNIFPESIPLFIIRKGPSHHFFGVAFEVWFSPADTQHPRSLLLRRCYKVEAYDPPLPSPPPDEEEREAVSSSKEDNSHDNP